MAGYRPPPLALSTTPENCRAPGRRSATRNEWRGLPLSLLWGISQGECRATISWPRGNLVPRICYLYGRKEPLECARTIRRPHLHEKKLAVLYGGSQVSTPSLSAKDRIIQETLPIMTPIRCSSVIIVTLCLCLTRRPDQNKAAAPYNLISDSDEIRVMPMCCCLQCGLGPDAPEGDLSCQVFRCPQFEFPLIARERNHLRLVGLLGVCAAPFGEGFTGVPLFPMFSRSPAVLGTVLDIFPQRVDPPRFTEVKGKIPIRGVNRLRATESERNHPVRRLGPLCTAASGDGKIPASRPLSVPTRASPSIGGVDVGVRIPLCGYGLVRRIPVGVRRLNQSWIAGTKRVVPIRKMIQPCAAGAAGSQEVVPIRRVNRSCTTSCNTEWERECEEFILIGLPSRSESRCPKRNAVGRTRMSLDASGIGARKGRNRCAERGVSPSSHGLWAWPDRHDWNRVTNFMLPWHGCCDWSPIIVVAFEQSDLVSPLLYHPFHLFSLLPDPAVTNLLRWKGTALLYRLKSSWETQALRTPQGSNNIPVSPGTVVGTTILLEFPSTGTPLLSAPLTSSLMGDMDL